MSANQIQIMDLWPVLSSSVVAIFLTIGKYWKTLLSHEALTIQFSDHILYLSTFFSFYSSQVPQLPEATWLLLFLPKGHFVNIPILRFLASPPPLHWPCIRRCREAHTLYVSQLLRENMIKQCININIIKQCINKNFNNFAFKRNRQSDLFGVVFAPRQLQDWIAE